MRKVLVFIGSAALAALVALWVLPRTSPPAVSIRPPAPTAEEEAGEAPGALGPDARAVPRVQAPVPPPRAGMTTPRVRHEPPVEFQGTAPVRPDSAPEEPSTAAVTRGAEGPASVPGEHGGPEAAPVEVAQDGAPDRTPVLMPPVLISQGGAVYPSDGYRFVLDRDALTPRLRVDVVQGRVILRILVRPDGTVDRVEVAKTSGDRVLDGAAVRTAAGWTFAPATRDGEPIEAWVLIPVRFTVP